MPGKEIFRQYLLTGVDRAFLDTMVVWLIGQALRVQRLRHVAALRASELSKQLAVAQLDNLRAQLQPHFLFNTLNSVAALVGEDAGRARTMIARLSELLRLSLQTMSEKLVTLAEELEIVSRYIEIQRLRFDDSMSFTVDVAGDCLDAAVPPFLLQPLVENSIKHGMDSSRRCCAILLQARRSGDALRIEITNDAETAPGPIVERVGLFNTRARLQALYGDACSLTIGGGAGASVTATIVLPFTQQRPAGRFEEPVLV
jgi:LytS/YehU family sensor histidine kinase